MRFVFVFALLFVGCLSSPEWWEDATFYQIYPRSFVDSDGDGVGDLKGISSKLEYLKEIGVTATWLSPIFKSPMADFGYDVSNFFEIDPIFGTMADFDELIEKSKEVGVKIILDFVPNHSSDECEYFEKSVESDPEYKDFYVWHPGKLIDGIRHPPSNWVSVFGGSTWTWNEKRQEYYLHQFLAKQPDFNFRNPKVRENFKAILKFWLDKGVYGFRIDAVPHIFEKLNEDGSWPDEPRNDWNNDPQSYDYLDHIYTKDQHETLDVMYEWRAFMDSYKNDNGGETRVILAEAYSPIEILDQYFSNSTHSGSQIPFNFGLMSLSGYSTAKDVENSVTYWMDVMWKKHKVANWVLGNHDNPRIYDRFGAHKIDVVNILLSSLPGTTVTYYGEELGMHNVKTECTEVSCDDRDGERTPMQWNDKLSGGFSTNPNPWLPLADDYKVNNVKNQRKTARSSFNIYKSLQKLKRTEAFKNFKDDSSWAYGALTEQIFHVKRSSSKDGYLILINMGDKIETYNFPENFFKPGIKDLEYHVVTERSSHYSGEKFQITNKLHLLPFEAVVMKWETPVV